MNDESPLDVDAQEVALGTIATLWRDFIEHVPFVIGASLILLITWLIAKGVHSGGTRALGRLRRRESAKELVLRLIGILIWVLGLLLTAIVLFPGLTPSKALGGLGLVSIAVGLAFKDIFENFFAGILILWRFPLERGDYIECEGLVGRVERVWMRMSYIRQTSGELVVVPNSFLFKNAVTVLTSLDHRRVTLMAGIAYDEDVTRSVGVIQKAVEDCSSVSAAHPVQVFPQAFGASSIDIEVCWWSGATPLDVRRSRGEVVTAIKRALDDAGIEIPYPYRTLVFRGAAGEDALRVGLTSTTEPGEPGPNQEAAA